jgi:uncharacterized protein (TIGR00645 family)
MKVEKGLETLLFSSRWLLAPFFVGLVIGIGVVLIKFVQELLHLIPGIWGESASEVIIGVLSLIDLALVASLLLIIIFAGYENFVSKINAADHEDRPDWMDHVDFADLKLKVIGSIVAISAIELLKAFVTIGSLSNQQLAWKVGIHLTFVVSGLVFALTDRLTVARGSSQPQPVAKAPAQLSPLDRGAVRPTELGAGHTGHT